MIIYICTMLKKNEGPLLYSRIFNPASCSSRTVELPAGGRGQICRARERFIRRGLVHTHGRRRRPVRGPGYHSFIAIFASGSGAAPRHVSAAAGATRWSHPSPTECGRAHPSAGGNARPAHRGFDHMDRANMAPDRRTRRAGCQIGPRACQVIGR
jgi:hypothetical protein